MIIIIMIAPDIDNAMHVVACSIELLLYFMHGIVHGCYNQIMDLILKNYIHS